MEQHAILEGPSEVAVWSTCRLPFDRRTALRGALQRGLRQLEASRSRPVLHGAYVSMDPCPVDLENILLYNVGAGSFSHLNIRSLILERSFTSPPPSPLPLLTSQPHYYNFAMREDGADWAFWRRGRTIASWQDVPLEHLSVATRVQAIWLAVKPYVVAADAAVGNGKRLALELDISGPITRRTNLTSLMKPLVDAVVSALTAQTSMPGVDLLHRLTGACHIPVLRVQEALTSTSNSPLTKRNLVVGHGDGIQWVPPDDLLCALRVHLGETAHGNTEHRNVPPWAISGRLVALSPAQGANRA